MGRGRLGMLRVNKQWQQISAAPISRVVFFVCQHLFFGVTWWHRSNGTATVIADIFARARDRIFNIICVSMRVCLYVGHTTRHTYSGRGAASQCHKYILWCNREQTQKRARHQTPQCCSGSQGRVRWFICIWWHVTVIICALFASKADSNVLGQTAQRLSDPVLSGWWGGGSAERGSVGAEIGHSFSQCVVFGSDKVVHIRCEVVDSDSFLWFYRIGVWN